MKLRNLALARQKPANMPSVRATQRTKLKVRQLIRDYRTANAHALVISEPRCDNERRCGLGWIIQVRCLNPQLKQSLVMEHAPFIVLISYLRQRVRSPWVAHLWSFRNVAPMHLLVIRLGVRTTCAYPGERLSVAPFLYCSDHAVPWFSPAQPLSLH